MYFYVCRWKVKKKKTINVVNTTFLKITQFMVVALTVTTIQAKNDDHYVWISKKGVVFFEIFVCETRHFVKCNGHSVPIKRQMDTNNCPILYDKEPLIDM